MRHEIDSNTLTCSCTAPMCFTCGWCSKMCVCLEKKTYDQAYDEVERVRESDYDARAGTR